MRDGFIDCGDGEVEVGACLGALRGLLSINSWLSQNLMVCRLLAWHLLSIKSWLSQNLMVCRWLAWHLLSINSWLSQNLMVCRWLAWHLLSIKSQDLFSLTGYKSFISNLLPSP